ncbi:protein HAPLESS 2-B isoform X1 [Oryza brachyantha]|uniref:Generative cell specific-1/HAP2 domain-containing protein n=1 Tax=Oryza brachyantha TaxID=4533 RepID=J3MZD1_ORYBR|nr:protein HAPLESS 2-B isoform X1 [Oryza brachyantha]
MAPLRRRAPRSSPPLLLFLLLLLIAALANLAPAAAAADVLAKSRLESCVRDTDDGGRRLTCDSKLVLDVAVPSDSSGGEASLVAKVADVEENDTEATPMRIRDPPVITINKSEVFALYALTYLRDVSYKPEEKFVKTRKCEPDAGSEVVKFCERLRDEKGQIIDHTEPVCCPCGPHRRAPSSCGNIFNKIAKGKANTAHCLRFPDDWFHVFEIGRRSLGFSISVQVKKASSVSKVIVGPDNRTVVSKDNFLRVKLVGDFVGYTSIPSFEDFYLVTPRKGVGGGEPQVGDDFSRWMLLERVRFTLDGLECNKIGVGYEAYSSQPNFCSSPLQSCLGDQLWNFWESDKIRVNNSQPPQYLVQGRFERINQHPNAGVQTFSVGLTEVLNTNLLIELNADDIEYIYQRSPGKIISINVSTFEALSQVGTAQVKTKNIGKLEASYSLTFGCSSGINPVEEQSFIMKPDEEIIRSFDLHSSTVQASNYTCKAILKGSNFSELDRKECQFSTTATVLNNGTQIGSPVNHAKGGIWGFFEDIKAWLSSMWGGLINFFTGMPCSTRCSSFFKLVMYGMLFLAVMWFLHQKGLFDPIYDWWDDVFGLSEARSHQRHKRSHSLRNYHHHHKRHKSEPVSGHRHHSHRILHKDHDDDHHRLAAEHVLYRHDRHEAALSVQHRDKLHIHKHRHAGKVVPPREFIWDVASVSKLKDQGHNE